MICLSPLPVRGGEAEHVLLLNSYHQTMPRVEDITRAVREELASEDGVIIHVENMDTKRHAGDAYRKSLTGFLREKYSEKSFSLILCSDNNAFDFLRAHRDVLFPGTPVLFCGVNDFHPSQLEGLSGFTGLEGVMSARDTVEFILKVHPDVDRILLVNDRFVTGRAWERTMKRQLTGLESRVTFEWAEDVPFEELIADLSVPEAGRAVLLGVYYSDGRRDDLDFVRAGQLLSQAGADPFYCLLDTSLGSGAVGGRLISAYYQGRALGVLARRVLGGESPADIPVITQGGNRFIFDYNALRRWDIAESSLPESSVVLFKPSTFYSRNRSLVWTGGTIFLIMGLVIVALLRAVALRRRTENRLRDSEAQLAAVFDQAFQYMGLLRPDGRVLRINETALKAIQGEEEDVLGHPFWESPWWSGQSRAQQRIRQAIENAAAGGFTRMEIPYSMVGKTGRLVDFSLKPYRDEHGRVRMLIAEGRDVTEQREAMKEVGHLRRLLHNIVNSMPSVIVGVDSEGKVTQWNRRAEEDTGLSAKKVLGRPLAEVYPRLSEQMSRVSAAIRNREVITQPKIPIADDGTIRYEDLTVYPLVANGVQGAVIRLDDVTERVRIEDMMIQTEKMLSVGGLAAGMAHEINNPLGGILQGAQNIQRRLADDLPANREAAERQGTSMESIRGYLEDRKILRIVDGIRESGERAARIVANMLNFSRSSNSAGQLCNLHELLENAVELAGNDYNLKKKYDFKTIEVLREYDPDVPDIFCVSTEIEQVMLNLLKNAAQAIASEPPEDRTARITVRTGYEGDVVSISIEDNGPGLLPEARRRVFEPFFTTKPIGEGTGLGLSVSYFIITQNHGGEMTVEDVPGGGARFVMRLPVTGTV